MTRRRVLTTVAFVVAFALVVTAVVVGARWWRESRRSDLARAVAWAPAGAERLSFTDWAGVREELDADLSAGSSTAEVADLLDRGYDADLVAVSAVAGSAEPLHARLGLSPATLEWELLSQSPEEAVVLLRLPGSTSFDDLAERLVAAGYTEPEDDDGVWEADLATLARLGDVTPELAFLSLDEEHRVVVASDSRGGAETGREAVARDRAPGAGLGDVVGALDGVDGSDGPLAAVLATGERACTDLSMEQADPVAQDLAAELTAAAGEVTRLTGYAVALGADRASHVVMGFASDAEARTNADARAVLAAGPAPGQGGDYADRFGVGDVTAEGRVVTMELEPTEGSFPLSELASGPVLLATCGAAPGSG